MINKNRFILISAILFLLGINSSITPQSQNVLSKDGVKIVYKVFGEGEPSLVFIHGWSCNKSYWDEQVKTFSPKYKVVTIDLAGHGESGQNRKDFTPKSFSADIAAVVNKLNLKKVIMIGHSMGGADIIEAAALLKGRVIGLIGADTFQDLTQTMSKEQAEQFLKPFRENFTQAASGFVKSMFAATSDTILVKKVVKDISSASPEIAINTLLNIFTYNAVPSLKKINLPIISINNDRYVIQVKENSKYVKSFKVKIMKGIGHFIMLEDPTKFNQLLQESIDELTKQ
ncbi:MAG: alpha/beta hydrolase [Ignavibacteriales bacterium]|nr:MAG: alpha/beta hydrolase [Ignavibacteriales bacterium]